MKRCCVLALVLLLLSFFGSKYSVEGRSLLTMTHSGQAVRDFQMKKEPLRGEKDSFRKIPRSGSNPIQNKCNPPVELGGSRKQKITASRKP